MMVVLEGCRRDGKGKKVFFSPPAQLSSILLLLLLLGNMLLGMTPQEEGYKRRSPG